MTRNVMVADGAADCVLALGFKQMKPGASGETPWSAAFRWAAAAHRHPSAFDAS